MNGFQRHGSTRSSASSINQWIAAPDVWVAKYLFGPFGPTNPAIERGNAAEFATVATISGLMTRDKAVESAVERYDDALRLNVSDDRDRERGHIAPIVDEGIEALIGGGEPELPKGWPDVQPKIEIEARTDDWTLPIIGYLDLVFPKHGLVVDIKTTLRFPSKETMPSNHQRQRAIYAAATNYAVKVLYITPKRAGILETGDPGEIMRDIKTHLIRLERFLSLGDANLLADIVPVEPDSFYWRGLTKARAELFNL